MPTLRGAFREDDTDNNNDSVCLLDLRRREITGHSRLSRQADTRLPPPLGGAVIRLKVLH